jgi:hypothetical protein
MACLHGRKIGCASGSAMGADYMFRGASFRVLAILHGVIPVQVRSLLSAENMLSSFTPVFRDTF